MTTTFEAEKEQKKFLLTRPLRDVTQFHLDPVLCFLISTHTPLAGRDWAGNEFLTSKKISTHTPLAGRDSVALVSSTSRWNFYSHAPCGT